jgi:hypothetical protein
MRFAYVRARQQQFPATQHAIVKEGNYFDNFPQARRSSLVSGGVFDNAQ